MTLCCILPGLLWFLKVKVKKKREKNIKTHIFNETVLAQSLHPLAFALAPLVAEQIAGSGDGSPGATSQL